MFKEVLPVKKHSAPPTGVRGKAYVRFTPKMLYISGPAMEMMGHPESIGISVNAPENVMVFTPDGPWKLSRVCETKDARRIETNGGLVRLMDAGFPKGMIGKYLMCHKDMMNALIVSLFTDYNRSASQ